MQLQRLTGIGRPIEWAVPGNRHAALIAGSVFALRAVQRGPRSALWSAFSVFSSWSLTRELLPDRPRAAVALALVAASQVLADADPHARAVRRGLATVAARIATRSTGRSPNWIDRASVITAAFTLPRGKVERTLAGLALLALGYDLVRPAARRPIPIYDRLRARISCTRGGRADDGRPLDRRGLQAARALLSPFVVF